MSDRRQKIKRLAEGTDESPEDIEWVVQYLAEGYTALSPDQFLDDIFASNQEGIPTWQAAVFEGGREAERFGKDSQGEGVGPGLEDPMLDHAARLQRLTRALGRFEPG